MDIVDKKSKRNEKWAAILRQCSEECKSEQIGVVEWLKRNHVDKKTYYKYKRTLNGMYGDNWLENTEGSEAVILPLFGTNEEKHTVSNDPAATIRIGKVLIELSNSVSPVLMRYIRELIGHAL